jgi:uncharacterized membrane protein
MIILRVARQDREQPMFILFVGLVIGFVLLMDARSKISRLQTRVNLLEQGGSFESAAPLRVEASETPVAPEPINLELKPIPVEIPAIAQPQITPDRVHSFATDPKPKLSWSFNFEDLFGRRLPIWAGGITLAIAGVLIAKYAIDAGVMKIFTPWVRVVGGLLFSAGLIAGAELASRHEKYVNDPRIRQALSGAGIATLYATVLVAANVYALIGPFAAFVALAAVTAGALALSIRFGAPSAVLGLAGGLAAPAMVGGMQPNVPMLAVYLALTIAGLAGVSRMQRWAWLGIIALAGGAGWSLWMIVASSALDTMASLSLGGLVLLLAIGLPMLVLNGPRATLFRSATTLVGAAQLALMVALGGFSMLNWGLFALLAAAGQWLNWRERGFAIVPTIGLVLSVALLIAWPDPALSDFVIVGLALALIHGGPLMLSVWKTPPVLQRMVELCGLALAVLMVPFVHYYPFFFHQTPRDMEFAWLSLGASLIPATALALGWTRDDRGGDRRFALATATTAILLGVAFCFATPDWLWPIGIAAIGASILFFGEQAKDVRTQTVAGVFAAIAVPLLAVTGIASFNDWERLAGIEHEITEPMAFVRWAFLAGVAVIFAIRARPGRVAKLAQIFATLLIYGAIAQILPVGLLPLVPPIALVCLAAVHSRIGWPQLAPASGTLGILITAWALGPAGIWLTGALASLGGVPMVLDPNTLTAAMIGKQLLIPALLVGVALWLWRAQMGQVALRVSATGAAIMGIIAIHALYRIGFASALGADFTRYGMTQRIMWEALLIGAGWGLSRGSGTFGRRLAAIMLIAAGALHTAWYTLLVYNPLWATQAVGGLPVINLIAPAFGLLFASVLLIRRMLPDRGERSFQWLIMILVAGFTWATLRQAFHGTLLVAPGVSGAEDILRSILAIGLAVGFLLWGIRTQSRDWRIASLVLLIGAVGKVFLFDASGLEGLMRIGSFIALGFSLIGIGWLYSRQLTHDAAAKITE